MTALIMRTVVLSVLAAFGSIGSAKAAPIVFDMVLNETSGSLGDGSGSFSIDGADFAGAGTEVFAPDRVDATLLSFDATVDGMDFAISDFASFPASPAVTFVDGVVTEVRASSVVASLINLDFNPGLA